MTDVKQAQKQAAKDVQTRSREVKPGHLEVGEFTSGRIGATAPFGRSDFPMPVKNLYFEYTGPIEPRILEDER